MCTAQNLLQRFFYRKSLTKFDAFSVAMACMLLAMKIEEDPRQPRAVVLVFHRMFERRMSVEPSGVISHDSLRALRDEMLRVELHVLKELGFGFYNIMDHPHKFILYYLRVLELDIEGDVSQRAWNYVNDSLRTDLSLRFRSEVIACAAIYMASRSLAIKLPDNPPWWVLFNADIKEMGEICNTILALYHRPKVAFLEPLYERSVFRKGGPLRKDAVIEETHEVQVQYTPADGGEECIAASSVPEANTAPTEEGPSTNESAESVAPANDSGVGGDGDSPAVAGSSAPGGSEEVHAPESNGASGETAPEGDSESRSESRERSRSRSKSYRSHSTSRSAPGVEREDGVSPKTNGRPQERGQDRERDRKRQREHRRSRSRSREKDSRRRDDGRDRDGDRERTRDRDRDRDRGRGRDWGRSRDRERDRRHDRGSNSRRSRR